MANDIPLGKLIDGEGARDAVHIAIAPMVAGEPLQPGQRVGVRDGKAYASKSCASVIGIVDPFLQAQVNRGQRFYLCLFPGTITSLRHQWTHPEFDEAKPNLAVQPEESRPTLERRNIPAEENASQWRTPLVVSLVERVIHEKDVSGISVLLDALEESGFSDFTVIDQLKAIRYPHEDEFVFLTARIAGGERWEAAKWIEDFAGQLGYTFGELLGICESYASSVNDGRWGHYEMDNTERYKDFSDDHWKKMWECYTILTGTKIKDGDSEAVPFSCSC